MSILHKIKNEAGGVVEVSLSPIRAIRRFCIECMGFQRHEIPKCTSTNCPLFPFRMGKTHRSLSPEALKKIADRVRSLKKTMVDVY